MTKTNTTIVEITEAYGGWPTLAATLDGRIFRLEDRRETGEPHQAEARLGEALTEAEIAAMPADTIVAIAS